MNVPAPISDEKKALVQTAIDEGWSQIEIRRTYGVDRRTLLRHFDYCGWDKQQSAEFGARMLHASRESGSRMIT